MHFAMQQELFCNCKKVKTIKHFASIRKNLNKPKHPYKTGKGPVV
jgi:hypothetical protein